MGRIPVLVAFLVLSLLLRPVVAGENGGDGEYTEVVVQGMGVDSDAALKNALRAAVQQAVGTMIDARTMVENDEIISDRILSHSGGYVAGYDMVGEPKSEGGLVAVRIAAQVKSLELREKLASEKVIVVAFDGKDSSAEAFTRRLQEQSAAEILPELFAGFPAEYMTVKMEGEPRMDEAKKKFVVSVRVSMDTSRVKALIKRLDEFLGSAVESGPQLIRAKVTADKKKVAFGVSATDRTIYLVTSLNAARTNAIIKGYPMNADMVAVLKGMYGRKPSLTIDLIDADGEPIMGDHFTVSVPYATSMTTGGSRLVILPHLTIGSSLFTSEPGTDSAVYNYSFDVSPEEIATIHNVKMEVALD